MQNIELTSNQIAQLTSLKEFGDGRVGKVFSVEYPTGETWRANCNICGVNFILASEVVESHLTSTLHRQRRIEQCPYLGTEDRPAYLASIPILGPSALNEIMEDKKTLGMDCVVESYSPEGMSYFNCVLCDEHGLSINPEHLMSNEHQKNYLLKFFFEMMKKAMGNCQLDMISIFDSKFYYQAALEVNSGQKNSYLMSQDGFNILRLAITRTVFNEQRWSEEVHIQLSNKLSEILDFLDKCFLQLNSLRKVNLVLNQERLRNSKIKAIVNWLSKKTENVLENSIDPMYGFLTSERIKKAYKIIIRELSVEFENDEEVNYLLNEIEDFMKDIKNFKDYYHEILYELNEKNQIEAYGDLDFLIQTYIRDNKRS